MPSQLIETIDIDATVLFDDDTTDVDPAYLDVMRVNFLGTALLGEIVPGDRDDLEFAEEGENLAAIVEEESLAGVLSDDREEYINELWEAVTFGSELLSGDDDDLKRDFAAAIDEDTLRELRATVGYVGRHLGIDVTLPTLEEVREA